MNKTFAVIAIILGCIATGCGEWQAGTNFLTLACVFLIFIRLNTLEIGKTNEATPSKD